MDTWKFDEDKDTVTNPKTGESVLFNDIDKYKGTITGGGEDIFSAFVSTYDYYGYAGQQFFLDKKPDPNRQRHKIINITTIDR